MNRKIKFRGKDAFTRRWIIGALIPNGKRPGIAPFGEPFHLDEVVLETVGQFTGLRDKNGREMYEGDIITDSDLTHEVCWYDDIAAFMAEDIESKKPFLLSDLDLSETVIIGNIFDNPSLISDKR